MINGYNYKFVSKIYLDLLLEYVMWGINSDIYVYIFCVYCCYIKMSGD